MASISKIALLISANASRFNAPMAGVINTLNLFQTTVTRTGFQLTSFRGAISAFGTYLLAKFVYNLLDANIETLEFSKRIGASTRTVQGLDFAIRQTGHSVENMRQGLTDLSILMHDARIGNIHAINTFKAVGLSLDDLRDKSPTAIFTAIAENISKIQDPAKQAGMAFRVFGENAQHLLPLLQGGADGIIQALEKARKLGLIIDNDKLEKLKAGRIAMENLRSSLDGFVLQLATTLAPYVITLIQLFEEWFIKNIDMENAFKKVGVAVGVFAQYVHDVYSTVKIMVLQAELAWKRFANTIKQSLIVAEIGFNKLRDLYDEAMGVQGIKDPNRDVKLVGQIIELQNEKQQIENAIVKLQDAIANGIVKQDVDKWFEEMNRRFAKGAAKIKQENDAINKAFTGKNLFNNGKKLTDNLLYPLETFQQKMMELREQLKTGNIIPDEFGRAAINNLNELESALGATSLRMAGLERVGTAAGVSAINRATMEQENANQSPQARIERLLKQGNMNQSALSGYAKRTAEALEDINVVEFK